MLINLLVSPFGEHPELTTACSYATPGGGRLYIGLIADPARRAKWQASSESAVWETSEGTPSLRIHLYGPVDFASFRRISQTLCELGMGILQIANQQQHASIVVAGGEALPAADITMRLRPIAERSGIDIAVTALPPSPNLGKPGLLVLDLESMVTEGGVADAWSALAPDEGSPFAEQRDNADFVDTLHRRADRLAVMPLAALEEACHRHLRLDTGSERLIAVLRDRGWRVGMITDCFDSVADKVGRDGGLDFVIANRLEVRDGRLTGKLTGAMVDPFSKPALLKSHANRFGIPLQQTVAIGSHAGDLPMLKAAGLGIAYRAGDTLRRQAPCSLTHGGLERVLDLL